MLWMMTFWFPIFITVNVCATLDAFTLTEPKLKTTGLTLTADVASTLVVEKLPRITVITTHTRSDHLFMRTLMNFCRFNHFAGLGGERYPFTRTEFRE